MTIEATVRIAAAGSESYVECQVLTADVHHGRDDATTQPVASTCVLELVDDLPAIAELGATVELRAYVAPEAGYAGWTRFRGEVTDILVGWESPEVTRPRIIATGYLGRAGRRLVGATPWPEELDGARAFRIIEAAELPTDPTLTDPGTVAVLARDVDRRAALGLAQETAEDGGGVLWNDRSGRVLYADAVHRRSAGVAFVFDCSILGIGLGWSRTLEGIVNDAYVRYGSPEAEAHATNPAAIAQLGTFAASLSTRIANAPDAQRRADELVARQAEPAWIVGGLETDLALLPNRDAWLILGLELHQLVKVQGLPASSPMPAALLWIEGWHESIRPESWVIAFATSDYCRTAAATRWDDLAQSITWDTMDPSTTWDSAVCFAPAPTGGAWDQVAPATRWDDLAPSILWDTWGTGP